jgi:UDP-glucose 4-epimerase
MTVIVTGAAGFIGSHLCRRLLSKGFSVTGIDCLSDYYPRWIKEKNLESLLKTQNFEFIPKDIAKLPLKKLIKKADWFFHCAAQAGVRASWGKSFSSYTKNNIQTTQLILEAAKDTGVKKIVYASSSSVYGITPDIPMIETSPLHPLSPYGVTKLAAEQLCYLYFKNYGVPAVSLRFFTVYGPGQRPDMAFHKFFKAILDNEEVIIYGDGKQTRDFTFVEDIVEANISAMENGSAGEVFNVGGGHREILLDVFPVIEDICQKRVNIRWVERQKGDVLHTLAGIDKARKHLNYSPRTSLRDGLKQEWEWIVRLYSS